MNEGDKKREREREGEREWEWRWGRDLGNCWTLHLYATWCCGCRFLRFAFYIAERKSPKLNLNWNCCTSYAAWAPIKRCCFCCSRTLALLLLPPFYCIIFALIEFFCSFILAKNCKQTRQRGNQIEHNVGRRCWQSSACQLTGKQCTSNCLWLSNCKAQTK